MNSYSHSSIESNYSDYYYKQYMICYQCLDKITKKIIAGCEPINIKVTDNLN